MGYFEFYPKSFLGVVEVAWYPDSSRVGGWQSHKQSDLLILMSRISPFVQYGQECDALAVSCWVA